MTTSNLDLARECGAYVYHNGDEIVFGTPAQLDAFAERIRADERAVQPADDGWPKLEKPAALAAKPATTRLHHHHAADTEGGDCD